MTAPTGACHVGLDVGASKVLGVVVVDGEVVAERRLPAGRGPDGVLERVVEAVTALAPDLGAVAGVGLGVPGLVGPAEGTVAHAVNLGIAGPTPLGRRLAERLGRPVVVENDLNVAALGAAHLLDLDGDLAYLALGTGVAAGLVLDGRLHRGARGAAGEIGHLPVRASGPRCACGQVGCLELLASGSAVDAVWTSRTAVPPTADLFAAAAAGDPRAVALRDRLAEAVATAVQVLVLTVDVPHVVLGGGVSEVGEPLRRAVADACDRRVAGSALLGALDLSGRLRLAPPGGRVAAVGAALAAVGRPAGRPAGSDRRTGAVTTV